jgi:hypothetical protein
LNPAASRDLPGVAIVALTLLLAQQLACRSVDEMQFGASLTNYRLMSGADRVARLICQPVLYVQSRSGAFENDVAAHGGQYDDARWPSK